MRRLAPEEAALWKKVIAGVKPIHAAAPPAASPPARDEQAATPRVASIPPAKPSLKRAESRAIPQAPPVGRDAGKEKAAGNTLDGSRDRRLSRGLVAPESSIDLHGHTLTSAYDRLDRGLEHAIARGDRVLLLVTGKPPRPDSSRPHARGAIRAAVGDWLAASRHGDRIAAVRSAHPRHGGAGALYIVLRRPRALPASKS